MNSLALGRCNAVIGLQWGDEGKGKYVDLLASEHDAVVRFNGGANAGHSVVVGGERFSLHLIPSGILTKGRLAVIGNGVVVDPDTLIGEVDGLAARGVDVSGLVVSDRAHVVMPYHKSEDSLREELLKSQRQVAEEGGLVEIGTTRRGIGPAYADKVHRTTAVRACDLLRPAQLRERLELVCWAKSATLSPLGEPDQPPSARFDPSELAARAAGWGARLGPMIQDTAYLLHGLLADGKRVLFEGANGTLLDVDHGTYPFVTSSSTGVGGIASGSGVPPSALNSVVGVMKSYSTRVGGGPMPTELHDDRAQYIRERGREYGTTTGRPRRVGWLDLVGVRYACMINGVSTLAVTLLDVLAGMDGLEVCTHYEFEGGRTDRFIPDAADLARARPVYERLPGFSADITGVRRLADLPREARRYLDFVQEAVGVRAGLVSVGPGREQTIVV
ncbi:MAG: adenylosuccinate synthase [Phycisphaerae bacterium]|nr:adenylosuccinate synthase [Phycisphaerae bacterium]